MSGDVTLVDTSDGSISRLVRTASALFDRTGFGGAALVGGLAVTLRLATVHRSTDDVDVVTDGDDLSAFALEYLVDSEARGSGRIEIDGVRVDVMPTSPLPVHAGDLPDGDLDRLFVLGHRWALETADEVAVHVVAADGPLLADVATPTVATAPALVACKLHAIADRRDVRSSKRESDALDLVRLVSVLVRSPVLTARFSSAPFDLAALVTAQAERRLISEATRTARLVNLSGGAAAITMGPDDVATIGSLFVEMLAP